MTANNAEILAILGLTTKSISVLASKNPELFIDIFTYAQSLIMSKNKRAVQFADLFYSGFITIKLLKYSQFLLSL